MPLALRHLTRLLLACTVVMCAAAPAAQAADQAFTNRFAQTVRGNITSVGNVLLTCPASAACSDAQNRIGGALNNNDHNMVAVDIDADVTTFNSSSATVSLPAGSEVVFAGLYWSSDTSAGTNGAAAANAALKDTVKLAVNGGVYQTVTAAPADVLTSSQQATRYRAFRDVTALVPASGSATYTVANVQAGTGQDRFAGWALIVAYRDVNQDIRRLNVYDGLGTVSSTQSFSTTIAPFQTPAAGPVETTVGLLAFEGDAGLASESATFNGVPFANALNPSNNTMNSTMTLDGSAFTAKNPNYANQLGTDLDSIYGTGFLTNGQTSAVLAFSSTQEYFMPSALYIVSDEGPPVNTGGPSMTGTAQDDSVLTANPGGWSGTPTLIYGYEWRRCDAAGGNCADIPGATGTTYRLTPDDVGSRVRVQVIVSNDAGSSDPATSNATAVVTQEPPTNLTLPTVTGVAEEGETLTSTLGTWDGTLPLAYARQWRRCDATGSSCVDIAGATGAAYTLASADVGRTIRVSVRASNDAGNATAASLPTGAVTTPPVADPSDRPATTGTVADGATLTAHDGTWTGTLPMTFSYVWQRCDGGSCTDIPGATNTTYTLTGADVGNTIRVAVTATNSAGQATATSVPTAPVQPTAPANVVLPTIAGTANDGATLSAVDGNWTGTAPIVHAYQWQRCDATGAGCVDIAGATASGYALTGADVGRTLRVEVTGTNVAGDDVAVSAPTAVVTGNPPVNVVPPTIAGTLRDGETLTADPRAWNGTQPMVMTYRWQRCDATGAACVDIPGATDDEYELAAADVGRTVRVVVTGTNVAGVASETAAATGVIAPAPPRNLTPPSFTGDPAKGETLVADPGVWQGTAPLIFDHQWQRCDATGAGCVDIPGATGRTYTPTAADRGYTLRVEVGATNAAGSAVDRSTPTPEVESAEQVAPPACAQLAGNAKYRRVRLAGIGTVRVRAYTDGRVLGSPVRVTTRIGDGRAKAVRYQLDGRRLSGGTIAPSLLARVGTHTLEVLVTSPAGRTATVRLRLETVRCGTVFSAQRWRATAGTGLRLRVDARTALQRIAFAVPSALLPRATTTRRTVGFLRVYTEGARRRFAIALPRKGAAGPLLGGRPVVRRTRHGVVISRLPKGLVAAELTLYRTTALDGSTTRATHRIRATVGGEKLSRRPRAPR